jgi:2'-5' RNA ligase
LDKIRIFIAIELTSEIREESAAVQDKLKKCRADVRWVETNNLHLTLKFLGYISASQLNNVFKATGKTVERISPFPLSFSGLGAFPELDSPRVIWAGVKEGEEILSRINRNFEGILKRNGFPPVCRSGTGRAEKREYHPHLTLGRVKSSKNKTGLIESVKLEMGCSLGSMEVQKVTVLQSLLKAEGPEYKPLHVSEIK